MQIYNVLAYIRILADANKLQVPEFRKIIKIPFLPYHLEGKSFFLTLANEKGDKYATKFEVDYVGWDHDGTIEGAWKIGLSPGSITDKNFADKLFTVIENDVLHKVPEF
ncbi:MAG TPA: hypothetical protein DCX32_01555 [Candidatus Moranbacteria bacterium]|nr:MAG: hypothetical protein UW95_C0028G0008 [Parcubacteria group bacterium GW2011_GWC1_45_14]HAV11207.1 hypothetical protein [Candidatus Moranbacteria bacterium]